MPEGDFDRAPVEQLPGTPAVIPTNLQPLFDRATSLLAALDAWGRATAQPLDITWGRATGGREVAGLAGREPSGEVREPTPSGGERAHL